MLNVTCTYFDWNSTAPKTSQCFTPEWVDKLYRMVARNYRDEFELHCWVDKPHRFREPVIPHPLPQADWTQCCLPPLTLTGKTLFMGLDTVIIDDISDIVSIEADLCLPKDPNRDQSCNGVVIANKPVEIQKARPGQNEMHFLNSLPHVRFDDLIPGQVVSYKGHVKKHGLEGVKMVYFHGREKPHEVQDEVIREHWR